jgi:hypothetical protein
LLLGVALAGVPSLPIVESYVGGSAIHGGYIKEGRYFVAPGHGRPIEEVSEAAWRTVYWVELLWPFSALVPGFIGGFLVLHGLGPNWKPPPAPPKEMPPPVLRACLASGAATVLASLLFWKVVGIPWATMLFGWILFCLASARASWFYMRWLRQQTTAESDASGTSSST